jgi:CDP-glycerol glycerophosphotransferase (TagB/SpsB family)
MPDLKNQVVKGGIAGLSAAYTLMKTRPTVPGKVVFLSRQSDSLSLDFQLLKQELQRLCPQITVEAICDYQASATAGIARFGLSTLKSMQELATSQVCVLDAYWPAVSLLQHKPDLTVIQMWHALGKIKQSGLAAVGHKDGRSPEVARALHMHEGYDYIIAGAPAWNRFYCESFGCTPDKLVNIGLPRMDVLTRDHDRARHDLCAKHPELAGKRVVLYAPTYRKHASGEDPIAGQRALIARLAQSDDFMLVVKSHPNQPLDNAFPQAGHCLPLPDMSTLDLLPAVDLVISDYSATLVEAATARTPFLLYCFDYDEYLQDNGLNLDLPRMFPRLLHRSAESTAQAVADFLEGAYPREEFDAFTDTYTLSRTGHATRDLAELVIRNTSFGASD